jgi:hypothetical protein
VAITGPRCAGSAAPQRSGTTRPAGGGCDVSTIARGAVFLARGGIGGGAGKPDINRDLQSAMQP